MRKVIIKAGTYGLRDKYGRVHPKTKADGPLLLSDDEAERLVKKGVAEFIEAAPATTKETEYSMKSSAAELRRLGKAAGLSFKANAVKEEMVAALDEIYSEEAPLLSVALPTK